jgi:hypothetical protein
MVEVRCTAFSVGRPLTFDRSFTTALELLLFRMPGAWAQWAAPRFAGTWLPPATRGRRSTGRGPLARRVDARLVFPLTRYFEFAPSPQGEDWR